MLQRRWSSARKCNATLMNEQGQYKKAVRMLNKEVKGKLEKADRQKQKLQEEVTALCEKVEMAGTDTVQKFKMSQLFIDSYANYYITGFDNCLKQVASTFPELDLLEITMDAPEPTMLLGTSPLMMMTVPLSLSFLLRMMAASF